MAFPLTPTTVARQKLQRHRGFRCSVIAFCCYYIQLLSNSKSISFIVEVDAAPVVRHHQLSPTTAAHSAAIPSSSQRTFTAVNMIEFMQRFGYLPEGPPEIGALYSESAVSEAIKNVQQFGSLPVTGILDAQTAKLMTSPRCGVADIQRPRKTRRKSIYRRNYRGTPTIPTLRRHRRFAVGARPWIKRRITYFLANWSPQVGELEMAQDMRAAFDEWAKYGNLKFVQVFTPDADIIVGFGTGHHGDNYPFDGPGNILAHAYYPYEMGHYGGDVHFDNDETWTRNTSSESGTEINFLSVAVHELGHSLGLGHSSAHNSIMFPYYKSSSSTSSSTSHHLGYDDVLAMYHLYIRANLPNDDDGDENAEDADTATTTEAAKRTAGSVDGETNTERIWPRITSTSSAGSTAREAPSTAAPLDNVTYHFHGDYETVDAHKRRFNYPETTPALDGDNQSSVDMVTSRTTSYSFWPRHRDYFTTHKWGSSGNINNDRSPAPTHDVRSTVAMWSGGVQRDIHQPHETGAGDLCLGNFDAATAINGHVFIFKNKFVWRMDTNLQPLPGGYPIPITQLFPGTFEMMSSSGGGEDRIVDAGYQRQTDGAVVLFSNHRYWLLNRTDFQLLGDKDNTADHQQQQRTIWDLGLPANLTRIDAVFVWPKNQKTYFFAGDLFWRYDESLQSMDPGYPKSISGWHGIPFHIDAAMTHPGTGQTLFFKNNSYWLFNDHWVRPEFGYPRLISSLFDC